MAYFLSNRANSIIRISTGETVDLAELFKEGIVNGVDPLHSEYWGKCGHKQVLVENASIIIGLMISRRHLLNKFSEKGKNNLIKWVEKKAEKEFIDNNWLWFKVFHLLFLYIEVSQDRAKEIKETLERIEEMYSGSGWYNDSLDTKKKKL